MLSLFASGREFSAIFCQNDDMAAGVLEACRQCERPVPDSLSVIGFDDMPVAHYLTPKLTTVRQPLVEMGAASALLAHAIAVGQSSKPIALHQVFQPHVVERASTSRLPRGRSNKGFHDSPAGPSP